MKKNITLAIVALLAIYPVASAQDIIQTGDSKTIDAKVSSTASLAELTADGNNVFIEFEDQTGTFDEKDQFLREYIEELTPWKIVTAKENADFILSVVGYSKRTAKSFASDTYFLTATIKRVDGTPVWTGKEVDDYANLYNGYGAVRSASKKLVEKTLLKEMKKAKK